MIEFASHGWEPDPVSERPSTLSTLKLPKLLVTNSTATK